VLLTASWLNYPTFTLHLLSHFKYTLWKFGVSKVGPPRADVDENRSPLLAHSDHFIPMPRRYWLVSFSHINSVHERQSRSERPLWRPCALVYPTSRILYRSISSPLFSVARTDVLHRNIAGLFEIIGRETINDIRLTTNRLLGSSSGISFHGCRMTKRPFSFVIDNVIISKTLRSSNDGYFRRSYMLRWSSRNNWFWVVVHELLSRFVSDCIEDRYNELEK